MCFQGLGSDDIIERSKHGNKEQKQNVQQKPVAASGDPNKHDFNKDDDKYKKKDKQKEQKTETENSFDPQKKVIMISLVRMKNMVIFIAILKIVEFGIVRN